MPQSANRVRPTDVDRADIDLAGRLADAARAAILPFYRARHGLTFKADASPVTLADRAAEAAMRALLTQERPNDGVIGEEYGADRPDAERVWILDPIDGTRSFISGRPLFTTLIALSVGEDFALGVIDQPVLRERWIGGAGHPTTLNGTRVRPRACAQLVGAAVATTSPHLFAADDEPRFLKVAVAASGGSLSQGPLYGGDAYNYALLTSGHLDLVVESGLSLHDFAALAPIVHAAGGAFYDWAGRRVNRHSGGDVIAAGDARLIDPVVALLTT